MEFVEGPALLDLRRLLDWKAYPPSAWLLIATNILAPLVAVAFGASPTGIVWAYWLESVVIGAFVIFTFVIMAARSASEGRNPGGALAALGGAITFSLGYFYAHAIYALFLFLLPWFTPDMSDAAGIAIAAFILSCSHGFSFLRNVASNPDELDNTYENRMRIMKAPYNRVLPMHIAIVLSGFIIMPFMPFFAIAGTAGGDQVLGFVIWLGRFIAMCVFVFFKTAADLFGHVMRYRKS